MYNISVYFLGRFELDVDVFADFRANTVLQMIERMQKVDDLLIGRRGEWRRYVQSNQTKPEIKRNVWRFTCWRDTAFVIASAANN